MWKNANIPRSDVPSPPSIEPSGTEPYYTRSCWPLPQSNLVVQSPTTPGQFDMWKNANIPRSDVPSPPSIEPSGTEPYYTRSCWPLPQSNLVVQSPTTPGQFDMWKNADIPRSDVPPPSIKPSGTEPCYTRSCWPLPQSNLVVQSPTTPGQFDMWKNADIPRSDVPPPSIKPSGTEPCYTRSVWHVEKCRCTQVRCTPSLNWT